jgi:hypothetical protein
LNKIAGHPLGDEARIACFRLLLRPPRLLAYQDRCGLVLEHQQFAQVILPDAITLARSGAITGLLWASWTAFRRWRRW